PIPDSCAVAKVYLFDDLKVAGLMPWRITRHKISRDNKIIRCAKDAVTQRDLCYREPPERRAGHAMGEIPEPMHDIAKRDSRAGKQPTQSASKENGNADDF